MNQEGSLEARSNFAIGSRKGSAGAIVLLLVLLTAGCTPPEVEIPDESTPLYFETIGRGQYGDPRDTIEAVAKTEQAWDSLQSVVRPLAPFGTVDFSQFMVALIALPAESGGYTIEVETVEDLLGTITISYLVSRPGTDCITPTAEALPFQAVTIQKAEGEIRFERRTESYTCGM